MAKYRRKPTTITAEQFRPGLAGQQSANVRVVEGGLNPVYEVYNGLHDSWIKLKPGDYIRTDDPNDNYPIDQATFDATYEQLAGPFICPNCKGEQADELTKCPRCRLRYCEHCIGKPCKGDFHQIEGDN